MTFIFFRGVEIWWSYGIIRSDSINHHYHCGWGLLVGDEQTFGKILGRYWKIKRYQELQLTSGGFLRSSSTNWGYLGWCGWTGDPQFIMRLSWDVGDAFRQTKISIYENVLALVGFTPFFFLGKPWQSTIFCWGKTWCTHPNFIVFLHSSQVFRSISYGFTHRFGHIFHGLPIFFWYSLRFFMGFNEIY